MPISRRGALKQFGATGAALLFPEAVIRGQDSPIRIAGVPVQIAVGPVSSSTVRITVSTVASPVVPEDGAIVQEIDTALARRRPVGPSVRVRAGSLIVRFTATPPVIHIETSQGRLVQRLALDAVNPGVSFLLPDGPLLGLGEGGPQFDRKGSTDAMRNGQGGYQLRTHGGRVPIQWLIGTDGWGMYIHHPLGSFDFTGAEGKLTPFSSALPIDVFVTTARDPAAIVAEYARVTGFAQLPPLWAFGYMQSHRTLAGPAEIRSVARTFREKALPCDALIYLGTEFTPSGWNTRNGEFTWKTENFPEPGRIIDELHAQHFKVILHTVIEGRRMSGSVQEPCTPDKAVPSGRDENGRWPEDRAVPCYWPYHKPLFDLGVDGFWPDQGDGLDAPSRLARIRMYWEGPQLWRPNERPFALHRNGYAGMQRYGAFLWSGDVYSTWETLKTHVPVAVNTGLSGIPFWGTDIGGFVPTAEYTGELHVRWFQFGTFCPSFRAHGRNWHLRLPWGWNTGQIGPMELRGYTGGAANPDPAELRNPHVEPIVRKYLELRYRLLPYTYTAAWECCRTGLPMMRALWLHHPDDPEAVACGDEFLWGRDILVSPVVEKGAKTRRLYLPRGVWYDFWTGEQREGGVEIERSVDLETMPLHVRAGAILPMAPLRQWVDQRVDGPLSLTINPGRDSSFVLYEDDGRTFDYRRGDWMGIDMSWRDTARVLTMRLAKGSRMRPPLRRSIEVRMIDSADTATITFAGRELTIKL